MKKTNFKISLLLFYFFINNKSRLGFLGLLIISTLIFIVLLMSNLHIKIDNFRTMFYNNNKEKTFPDNFYQMSKQDFDFFFEGLINSDGSIGKTSMEYNTSSKELKDKLSALFSINGIMFTIKINSNSEKNENWKDVYKITIALKNKSPMFNDSRSKYYAKEIDYSGMVYCAETETGLIIVRRNGKIVLCGNCSVLEHCSFTFKVEGISRSCSH